MSKTSITRLLEGSRKNTGLLLGLDKYPREMTVLFRRELGERLRSPFAKGQSRV